jgi:hypothetical protein
MKKVFTILISLALLTSVAIVPVYAGGGQNNGDIGQGTVGQGELGEGTSPGDDAQGNQVD